MRVRFVPSVVSFALLLPSTALANAGTPLMWATMAHLALGNLIIGTAEGLLISFLLKTPRLRSILALVAANYASAWIGGLLLTGRLAELVDMTMENLRPWFCALVAIAFLVTLIIEFPFFWLLSRKREHAVGKALKAALLVNLASYILLCGWYWNASRTSMLTRLEVVTADQLHPPSDCVLWFISPDGNHIVRSNLAGQSAETVRDVSAPNRGDRLFAQANARGSFDLHLLLGAERTADDRSETIQADFSPLAPIDERRSTTADAKPYATWFNFGAVPSLATNDTHWKYRTGFWAAEGLSGENAKTGERVYFALEIPFVAWIVRNAVQLDGGLLLFQLGHDQICLLDPSQKRIALVARGKGPLVAKLHDTPIKTPPQQDRPAKR